MRFAITGAAALLLAFSATSALAMPGNTGMRSADPEVRYAQMDVNKDGSISWEEFTKARPNLNRNAFDTIDTDKDGGICISEWRAFSSGHGGAAPSPELGKMMKAMKGGMPAAEGTSSGMPLIMPPASEPGAKAPAMPGGMPLITPPAGK